MPSSPTPALLNHAVSRPWPRGRRATTRWRRGVPDVLLEPAGSADLGRGTARALAVHVGDDDAVAARDHPLGDPAADPAGASGDDAAGAMPARVNQSSRPNPRPDRTSCQAGPYRSTPDLTGTARGAAVEGNHVHVPAES